MSRRRGHGQSRGSIGAGTGFPPAGKCQPAELVWPFLLHRESVCMTTASALDTPLAYFQHTSPAYVTQGSPFTLASHVNQNRNPRACFDSHGHAWAGSHFPCNLISESFPVHSLHVSHITFLAEPSIPGVTPNSEPFHFPHFRCFLLDIYMAGFITSFGFLLKRHLHNKTFLGHSLKF